MISRRCPIVPMLVLVRQSLFSNKVWTRPHPPSVASACRCDLDPPTDNHAFKTTVYKNEVVQKRSILAIV